MTPPRLDPETIVRRMNSRTGRRCMKAAAAFQRGDLIAAAGHWKWVCHQRKAPSMATLFARYGLAMVAHHARQHHTAIDALEGVVADAPGFDLAWYNLGTIRQHVGDYAGAEAALRMASAINPTFGRVRTNLGNALLGQGKYTEAMAVFDAALTHHTGDPEALWNRSHALVATGRWLEGWACYEARWSLPGFLLNNSYHHPSPIWQGEPLGGKHLIIIEEQGYGDLIMTLRYDRDLKAQGAAVTWAVRPELLRLCRSAGIRAVDINTNGSTVPADYHAPCMSLMRWTRTVPSRMPQPSGYLHATPHRHRLPGINVGICWQGSDIYRNNTNRSLPGPLIFDGEEVSLISVCRDGWTPDIGMIDGLDGVTDWQDTADRLAGLDLVITVDTAIAHLAGALNVPVWILLAAVPDMRWGLQSTTTPWYRSARLYRQATGGDWGPVLDAVTADLGVLTQRKAAA